MKNFIMKLIQRKINRLSKKADKINAKLERCYAVLDRWEQMT